jgi:O-antigen ligase
MQKRDCAVFVFCLMPLLQDQIALIGSVASQQGRQANMEAAKSDRFESWRDNRMHWQSHRRTVISKQRASDILLWILASLALLRGTRMWFGYPTSQADNETISPVNMQLMLYALCPLTLFYLTIAPRSILRGIPTKNLALIFALGFIALSVIASIDIVASVRGLFAAIVISVPLLLFYWRFGSVGAVRLLRNFAIAAIVVNLAYVVVFPQYGFMSGSLAGTMRGAFPHKNLFGQAMAVYFIVLLPSRLDYSYIHGPKLFRTLACIGAIACIILAKSSTAIVQAGVGLLFMALASSVAAINIRTIRTYISIIVFLTIVLLVGFGGIILASSVAEGLGKDLTLSGRSDVWAALMPHILDRPVTGYGFAMMRSSDLLPQFTTGLNWGVHSTHNTYIELLLNIGIPGAIAWFIFLIGRVFTKLVHVPSDALGREARNRQIAIMLMILFGAFTEAGQMFAPLAMWTILLLTLPLDSGSSSSAIDSSPRANDITKFAAGGQRT